MVSAAPPTASVFQGHYRPRSVINRDDFDTPTTAQLCEKVDNTAVDNLATA
ncbi:hypothetical protein ACQP2U_13110 [Nocardia sp. CA-084685]|uniref:hypothetical protein n=1 Tax=Nocardia sp. CA-084685 TaxID=3239970 RepID=UPI003D98DD68